MINPGWAVRARSSGSGLIWRVMCVFSFAVAAFGLSSAEALAASCNINTTPTPAVINAGGSVQFNGTVGGKRPTSITSWTFPGGTPTSVNGDVPNVTVTYASAGNFTATMNGLDGKDGTCSASVPVTVNAGGNQAPIAADDSYSTSQDTQLSVGAPGVLANDSDPNNDSITAVPASGATTAGGSYTLNSDGSFTYTPAAGFTGDDTFDYQATDGSLPSNTATVTITVNEVGAGGPTARGDAYATPVATTLNVTASRVSGVLYNDFGGTPPLTAVLVSGTNNGSLNLNADGSFSYTPNASLSDNQNDSFVYYAMDALGNQSDNATVNINILSKQTDFKIMMNYELGMHCTGFEFAYCCVLPPYNSILAQVVKPQAPGTPQTAADFPRLLEGDHNNTDGLGRPIVMRDAALDGSGNFKKYFLEYYHDAQPRRDGQGKPQTSTLISAVEGNSLFYTSTIYDSAALVDGKLQYGEYEGAYGIVQGNGDFNDPTDNYANGWLNHFYIYADLEGTIPVDPATNKPTTREDGKIRLGVTGHVEYPKNVGAALQPMGPDGAPGTVGGIPVSDGGVPCFTGETDGCVPGFDNVLTFSGDTGTVVYTQMKVLENLPVMLTSPHIWEALGLPLTPFEDSIDFFGDPGLVDEDSIRPYVAMKARLHEANCDANGENCTKGPAVIGSNGKPVIGHGTAPIDIPNCERCHSVTAAGASNSPVNIRSDFGTDQDKPFFGTTLGAITSQEKSFWDAYYDIIPGVDSDWYSRLKSAAINMLALHDYDQGTGFTTNWPSVDCSNPATCSYTNGLDDLTDKSDVPQNTRLGKESVICQKCHADNVIAVVKSGYKDVNQTQLIKPITEAIHWRHREISEGGSIDFADAAGRSGGCQGCHPAHRSDGVMDGYPITLQGDNFQRDSDNRLAAGGCFVGRDVHSNPNKDNDGAETPAHLNAVGQWLADNVFHNQSGVGGVDGDPTRGLWCTNCHSQLGQEMWRKEDCNDLINGDCLVNPRGQSTLAGLATVLGYSQNQLISWLDPKSTNTVDDTHTIWKQATDGEAWTQDAGVATIEVDSGGNPVVTTDADGDISVNILSFCTTLDCVTRINNNKTTDRNSAAFQNWRYPANPFINAANSAAAVPFSAATDGRDHWLSPGEPHCADCHAAPYVEQSGNINAYPPFNYPAKASLMRYSKGHQGVTCQGCHESIHGLYPVTPTIDSTSYAQAAALNHDGSHGPLKCGTCHTVNSNGIPTWIKSTRTFGRTFDDVVTWAHTYTDEADPLDSTCQNCHGDRRSNISESGGKWLRHAFVGRIGRATQDKAEISALGHVAGDPDTNGDGIPDRTPQQIANTVCSSCHSLQGGPSGTFLLDATCDNTTWKQHLTQGRLSEKVWEFISASQNPLNPTCGW